MKHILKLVFLSILAVLMTAGLAAATTYTLSDMGAQQTIYWDGWKDTVVPAHDTMDLVGAPQIFSLQLDTNANGYLQTVKVLGDPGTNVARWGFKLFIDNDADQNWEYFLNGIPADSPTQAELFAVNVDVNIAKGVNDNLYIMSSGGDNFRHDHPVGIVSNVLTSKGLLALSYASPYLTIDFTGTNIKLDDNSWIGSAVVCANDVTLNQIGVPEPGTLIFLGTGLIGLAFAIRRRKNS